MTNPWSDNWFYTEPSNGAYNAHYTSPVYDGVDCHIIGTGDTEDKAILSCIKNILSVMSGYDKAKVEEYVANMNQ
jgi:hypothetical protein